LKYGYVEKKYFDEEYLNGPDLLALMQKIKVVSTKEYDEMLPEKSPATVEITTKSGKKFSETVYQWRGYYSNFMTEKEIERKFRSLAGELITPEQSKELLSKLWNLDKVADMGEIMELLKV
jgi:2-methylcitrate dehydratase PrpD